MTEKLTESITFKCTDAEKIKLERIARSRKQTLSELCRIALIDVILDVEELLKSLQAEFDLTTDTADTRNPVNFELTQSPAIRRSSTKPTGTKKAQLLQQKDFFAVHSEK